MTDKKNTSTTTTNTTNMKTCPLTIDKKWFNMIASEIKKEEYLPITPYWKTRLLDNGGLSPRKFDTITFSNGYSPDSPLIIVEHLGTAIGNGKIEWGAKPCECYFVLHLGKILHYHNIKP